MNTWHFRFTLDPQGTTIDDAYDRLHDAGCDDALFSSSDGREFATFARRAETLDAAVMSAITDIERVAGVSVTEVSDQALVKLEDIARLSARSIQSIERLIAGEDCEAEFPRPLTWDDDQIQEWEWSRVAEWFAAELGEKLPDPNATFFTALSDSLKARRSCRRLAPAQRKSVVALLDT